jgi:hypothetical protein
VAGTVDGILALRDDTFEAEFAGGKSSVAFSYRIVGRRKDIRGHKRFAKIDTRLLLSAAATRRGPQADAGGAAQIRRLPGKGCAGEPS